MNQKNLGIRIRECREEMGLTQKSCGEVFNIKESTWSNYEKLYRVPDYVTLKNFAQYFNVSLDYLLGVTDLKLPIMTKEMYEVLQKYMSLNENKNVQIRKNSKVEDLKNV